jgi:hypothetical protein
MTRYADSFHFFNGKIEATALTLPESEIMKIMNYDPLFLICAETN